MKKEGMACLAVLVFRDQKEKRGHLVEFALFVLLEIRVSKAHLAKMVLMALPVTEVPLVVEEFKVIEETQVNQVYQDQLELPGNQVDQECLV